MVLQSRNAPGARSRVAGTRALSGDAEARGGSAIASAAETAGAVLAELDSLIGLGKVKELVHELQAWIQVQRRRREAGLKAEPMVLHMIFKGNPGTGKTTVARIIGRLFKALGILEKGHVVEVERADLVGEYIGHTAQKVREQVKRALGGILFVDEAYSLARGGEKDFGREAIDALVKAMEDHRHSLVLILAGYRDEMEWFLCHNPGLRSRFPIHIDFVDYTADELLRIADHMARERDYCLTPAARAELARALRRPDNARARQSGNARLIRNVVEKAIRQQAVRVVRNRVFRREDLMLLTADDLAAALAGAGLQPGAARGGSASAPRVEPVVRMVPSPAPPGNGRCESGEG